jgi:hypothetical protein
VFFQQRPEFNSGSLSGRWRNGELLNKSVRYISVSLPYISRRICCGGLPSGLHAQMEEPDCAKTRRAFRWSGEAREIVRSYLSKTEEREQVTQPDLKVLLTRLVLVSGNPRDACRRFARQAGVGKKQTYRSWTRGEQQKLLDLIATHPVHEVTLLLRRSAASVRSMLQRDGWPGFAFQLFAQDFSLRLHRPDVINI